jgi:nucleotide-binding universal stress UspA family protein
MRRVLVPVDGSASSDRAVQSLIQKYRANPKDVEIHLLNVQHPLSGDVNTFVDHDEIKQYHHDEGIKALTSARQALDRAGLPYFFHVSVGEPAESLPISPTKKSATRSSWARITIRPSWIC